jgi:hypothetical protein
VEEGREAVMYTMGIALIVCFGWVAAGGQERPGAETGAIRGIVKESPTSVAIASAAVTVDTASEIKDGRLSQGKDSKQFKTQTDSAGRFELRGLPPGRHLISVRSENPPAPFAYKQVVLLAGWMERQLNFSVAAYSSISGKVEDHSAICPLESTAWWPPKARSPLRPRAFRG